MDPITDVFNTMHVTSVVHAKLEATAPWGLIREVEDGNGAALHSAASENPPCQFAHFGMVSRGNCWLSVGGMPDPLPLTGGDCFLLAPGSTYALRDDPRTSARSFCEAAPKNGTNVIHYGGGGAPTTIISGWFRFDEMSFAVAGIGNVGACARCGSNGQPAGGYFVHPVCPRPHSVRIRKL